MLSDGYDIHIISLLTRSGILIVNWHSVVLFTVYVYYPALVWLWSYRDTVKGHDIVCLDIIQWYWILTDEMHVWYETIRNSSATKKSNINLEIFLRVELWHMYLIFDSILLLNLVQMLCLSYRNTSDVVYRVF